MSRDSSDSSDSNDRIDHIYNRNSCDSSDSSKRLKVKTRSTKIPINNWFNLGSSPLILTFFG